MNRAASAPLQTVVLLIGWNVFMTFAMFYRQQPFKTDYLWAGLCLVGAVYFMFRR